MERKQTRHARWKRTSLPVFAMFLSASLAFAGSAKLSKDLQGQSGSGQIDVIVQFNLAPTAAFLQNVVSNGGTLKQNLGQFKGAVYTVPASALSNLAAGPDVVYISPDRPLYSTGKSTPTAALDYHTAAINAPAAWALDLDGTGIGVAVIDSGIAANSGEK